MSDRIDPMLRAAGERLRIESSRLSEALDHRAEIGRARESKLSAALARFLPRRYALGTGFVLGPNEEISAQQDVLIFDAERYPNFVEEHAALLVPESLYGVISVRTVLRSGDLPEHVASSASLRDMIQRAVPSGPIPLYVLFAYRFEGDWHGLLNRYGDHVVATASGSRIDMICTLTRGGICFDASRFSGATAVPELPAAVLQRTHVFGMSFHASTVEPLAEPFVDFYKLLLRGLTGIDLTAPSTHTVAPSNAELRGRPASAARVGAAEPLDDTLRAEFSGKSADMERGPGELAQFAMIFFNSGQESWVRGTATEARLSVVVTSDDSIEATQRWAYGWVSANSYAVQAVEVIPPAHNGFFIFNVIVPAEAPAGTKRFHCRLVTASGRPLTPESYANTVFVRRE